jgi:urea transporter
MKNYEILEVNKKSIFKTTIYITSIPLSIMAIIGIIMCIVAFASGRTTLLFMGIPYIIMPIFMLFIYGLLSMLVALVYNKFAKKYGGLELRIVEKSNQSDDLVS